MAAPISHSSLDRFLQELCGFARSDTPMPQGMRALEKQLERSDLKTIAAELAEATERGVPLSDALEKASHPMPPSLIAVIRCAEATGRPSAIFEFALEHQRRMRRHREAIFSAALYPLAVLALLVLVFTFMTRTVVVKMEDVYGMYGAELPALTKILRTIGLPFRGEYGWLVGFGLAGLILLPTIVPRLREWLVVALCRLPAMGTIATVSDTAIAMRFLAETLQRGVPFPDALGGASTTVALPYTRASLLEMAQCAERGEAVAGRLHRTAPATAAYLFSRGEQRGDLPQVCGEIAAYCEDRFEVLSRRAMLVLEPALTVLVGLAVLAFVVSLYLPMFQLPGLVR